MTSSTTTPTRSTTTGTARTSPSTIAEAVNNGVGLTGHRLRREASCPCACSTASARATASRSRPASGSPPRKGAKIINLSLRVLRRRSPARQIPDIIAALALRAAQGRAGRRRLRQRLGDGGRLPGPLRATSCPSARSPSTAAWPSYSNYGPGLDIVAPGGGDDAALGRSATASPTARPGRNIIQMTYDGSVRRFGFPGDFMGTSMAAPHVSAIAALVVASGVIGPNPTPRADREPPQAHRARPRQARLRPALRRGHCSTPPRRHRARAADADPHRDARAPS